MNKRDVPVTYCETLNMHVNCFFTWKEAIAFAEKLKENNKARIRIYGKRLPQFKRWTKKRIALLSHSSPK